MIGAGTRRKGRTVQRKGRGVTGRKALALALLATLLLLGCAPDPRANETPDAGAYAYAVDAVVRATGEEADSLSFLPDSIENAMPNMTYELRGDDDALISKGALSDAVVRGRVVGYALPRTAGLQVGTLPAEAIDLTFEVAEDLAERDGVDVPDLIKITVVIRESDDPTRVGKGFVDAGELVLFLSEPSGALTGWQIPLNGMLFGRLAQDGLVTFPVLKAHDEDDSLLHEGIETTIPFEALRTAGRAPEKTVAVRR